MKTIKATELKVGDVVIDADPDPEQTEFRWTVTRVSAGNGFVRWWCEGGQGYLPDTGSLEIE